MDRLYREIVDRWRARQIRDGDELAAALENHRIAFAYHSGKIENDNITYNDTREIFNHGGVTDYTGDLRTLFEIANAKDASELVIEAFDERRPLDMALVKELHFALTKGTYDTRRYAIGERPGEFKRHDYAVGREEVGALPEDVEEELGEVLEEISKIRPKEIGHVLTGAAYFHAKFEHIHPFADGNGRTGRLAMNYFLLLHEHPPIVFHEEDRKEYYGALEAWDRGQDLDPMKDFAQRQTVKTWGAWLERLREGERRGSAASGR